MSIASRIAENQGKQRRSIEVPEWGDDAGPLVIYCTEINGADIDKVQRKHKDFLNNMTIAGMVELIIIKAEDADGNRIFTLEDKFVLMKEPAARISDIGNRMFNGIQTIEDQEKN